jgi:hypothetical protein
MACKSVLIKCQNVQKFLRRRNSQIKGSRSSIYAAFVEATTVGKHLIAEKMQRERGCFPPNRKDFLSKK